MLFEELSAISNRRLGMETTAFPFSRAVIFGASDRGDRARKRLEAAGVEVAFFVDNDPKKQNGAFHGVLVQHPDSLQRLDSGTCIVIASGFHRAIGMQLDALGVSNWYALTGYVKGPQEALLEANAHKIERVLSLLEDEPSRNAYLSVLRMFQMDDLGYLRSSAYAIYRHPQALPRPGEVILDVGAYDGDTAWGFYELAGREATVHCLEPVADNYAALVRNIAERGLEASIIPHNFGAWNVRAQVCIAEKGTASHHCEEGAMAQVLPIDEFAAEYNTAINFIKMDIEGAELEALQGAAEVVRANKPTLQICVYHRIEHLWEIPLWVHEQVPEYRLYFGHHCLYWTDSVLYAVHEDAHA